MTEDPQDKEYLDLFKPKDKELPQEPPAALRGSAAGEPGARPAEAIDAESVEAEPWESAAYSESDRPVPALDPTLRTMGLIVGGGCLLLVLTAVVVFAFVQVFFRSGEDAEVEATATPTQAVALTPSPGAPVAESPLIRPLVNSEDVRVPVALPERLVIGERVWNVQPVNAASGTWPDPPASGDAVSWAYGTVVNYVLAVAPTAENAEVLAALEGGDVLNLHLSTGLNLGFNVSEVMVGAQEDASFFAQVSPGLSLALLTDDAAARTVVTATFLDAEATEEETLAGAVAGVIGTPVDQGPVRLTVLESYHVAAEEAGLPPGTGYLLVDFRAENVGTVPLETDYFQTFVSDAVGERYPLTEVAAQFAHYGVPSGTLTPGETVIGSLGYLVPRAPEGHVRWAFNPLPGSDHWVLVPLPYELPLPTPTSEPPPPVGFAQVTLDADDIFVDQANDALVIGLEIVNQSFGEVVVTEDDISLSSFPNGEAELVSAGPLLPWTITPGESRLFELHFELPSDDPVLLTVLGYSFEIMNVGQQ